MSAAAYLLRGVACRQAGQLAQAEQCFRRALEAVPRDADANHLLGQILAERGQHTAGAALVARAIAERPEIPAFHSTLGQILEGRGALREACLCYRQALLLDPAFLPAQVNLSAALNARGLYREAAIAGWKAVQACPGCAEAFDNLGNALAGQEQYDDAAACHCQALRLNPRAKRAWLNLSGVHLKKGRFEDAARCARQALDIDPGFTEALANLSVALGNANQLEEAETVCRRALELRPQAPFLHSNLGSILLRQRRPVEAGSSCRRALELDPRHWEAAHNLGAALVAEDRWEEAIDQFRAIVRAQPDSVAAWIDLGGALYLTGLQVDEARACFEEALRWAPESASAHLQRALMLLAGGRFAEGFAEYEFRHRAYDRAPRALALPAWDGSPLDGRTLLLFAEQGLGDTLQFVRYATLAARRGRVVVECQPRLRELVATVPGVSEVVASDQPLPACDVQAGLLSLPGLFRTASDTVPGTTPYLRVDADRVKQWKSCLGPPAGLRVGLFWAGNPGHQADRYRSTTLRTLEPLRQVPGVEWHSLQVGQTQREELRSQGGWARATLPAGSDINDLAALMACLDLVISVDSMPGHLAGALARPVWTLVPFAPDWRWQLGREDTPWYPTMRLFRQKRFADWSEPVARVAEELGKISIQTGGGGADMDK